jgi:hypothetical protein
MSEIPLQHRVQPWMMECFGPTISADKQERNHRFLEESLELVQACGATSSEAHQLVDYVYGRPVGDRFQEVGGVMITLAALCLANDLDMHQAGEVELARIWTKVEQIRAKQATKPKHSPLPAAPAAPAGYKLVPIEPTEDMIMHGFESAPSLGFSEPEVWDAYEELSGCQQASFRAQLCWAAMLAAAPETWKVLPSPAGAPPLDDELRDILGRPCFTLIGMAQMLRSMGHDIKRRAEDEQAVSIHWMLDLYMKHGSEWRTEAARIIQEFKDGLSKPTGELKQEAK